jgi:transposase-like protein
VTDGVINKSDYSAIGINVEGLKDVLGIWLEQSEGAKYVFTIRKRSRILTKEVG